MSYSVLLTLYELSGLRLDIILQDCHRLRCLEEQIILAFYTDYGRFPTLSEADLIADIGLPNYNCLHNDGVRAS